MWDRGDRSQVLSLVSLVACAIAWLLAAVSIGLLAVATVNGRLPIEPRLAGPITVGLSAFLAANAFALIFGAQMRQVRLGVNLGLAAGLNIAFDPSLGTYGAALATFIGYVALLALNLGGLRTSDGAQPRAILAALAVCLGAVGVNGLVAGTDAWPVAALASAAALLSVAPVIYRLVRTFPWPAEPRADSTVSGVSSGSPEAPHVL
jgi:hypothetical protein